MSLTCNDCGKVKEEVVYSPYEEKPVPRCEDCHFAAMIKNNWGKDPEVLAAEAAKVEATRLRKIENLKKARNAMKAKREAKKQVQEGKREIVE